MVEFGRKRRRKSPPPLEQELSHRRVLGQANCPVESIRSLRGFPQALPQMSANGPVGLIIRDRFEVDPIQYREASFRPDRFAGRGGVPRSRAERWGNADQLFVKQS